MRIEFVLIILLATVVAIGGVYLFRPDSNSVAEEMAEIKEEIAKVQSETVVDNTKQWPPSGASLARRGGPPKTSGPIVEPLNKVISVTLETSLGDIKLALDGPRAPYTVGNFVQLARDDFYDGVTFHRVIPGFMVQGGDPFSRDQSKRETHGRGGPGYFFSDEINERKIVQGTIAMANGGPNTNGSQFFIVTAKEVPSLDGKHTAFGVVEEGMDVVVAISKVERDERDNPTPPVIIRNVVVHEGLIQGLEPIASQEPGQKSKELIEAVYGDGISVEGR